MSHFADRFSALNNSTVGSSTWDDGKIKVKEFIVLEVLVAIFAIIGNALVLVAFYKERRLRKKSNYYIISLACADFCVGIFGIPLAISLVIKQNFYEKKDINFALQKLCRLLPVCLHII